MCCVASDLCVGRWELTHEEEDGGGQHGVDADEEVDAHVADECHLCILEDSRQKVHPGESGEPEELLREELSVLFVGI